MSGDDVQTMVMVIFQIIWLCIISFLLSKIYGLKQVIAEMRSALAPFARTYEDSQPPTHHSYKRAFQVFTENK